jgi:hypothetical protein
MILEQIYGKEGHLFLISLGIAHPYPSAIVKHSLNTYPTLLSLSLSSHYPTGKAPPLLADGEWGVGWSQFQRRIHVCGIF